jgi:glycyl-tRNA synthetase
MQWYIDLGIPEADLQLRPHDEDELSHYSSQTSDVEYRFPWGFDELEGIANRGDFDLTQHAEASGEALDYFDPQTETRYVPHVIEPAAGATRTLMAFLLAAYDEEEVKGETRVVLRLHHRLAPYKVAVLPLSRKEALTDPAKELFARLAPEFMCDYDETQSIGRRYRRQDELGTPYAVTFDFDSLEDHAVTVRERDTMEQVRLPIDDLAPYLRERLA